MFIEYKDGEKHTGKIDKAELSENITTFNSCGELIADNEVVIDIDHLPKESIMIHADGQHLWRVLENLYNNAVKYAAPNSRVYVDMKNSNWSVDTDGHTILFTPDNKFMSSDWVDKAYFHPISTNDLALNPNLGQNPGY